MFAPPNPWHYGSRHKNTKLASLQGTFSQSTRQRIHFAYSFTENGQSSGVARSTSLPRSYDLLQR